MPREAQHLSPSSPRSLAVVSWTGGKDCNLALLSAWRNPTLEVIGLVVFVPEGVDFKAHPIRIQELQATALSLPLTKIKIPKGATDYKAAYMKGMRELNVGLGVEVIVTGDMDLVDGMPNWMEECAAEVEGIKKVELPLWRADRVACLERLVAESFSVVFSCVKSPWLDKEWIGMEITPEVIEEMKEIAKRNPPGGALPLDLGGENGEYHSMVLNGPLYEHGVHLECEAEPRELEGQPGQEAGAMWWTLKIKDASLSP